MFVEVKGRIVEMNHGNPKAASQETFQEIIKKAYERGMTDSHVTVGKLLDELIGDLKDLLTK